MLNQCFICIKTFIVIIRGFNNLLKLLYRGHTTEKWSFLFCVDALLDRQTVTNAQQLRNVCIYTNCDLSL